MSVSLSFSTQWQQEIKSPEFQQTIKIFIGSWNVGNAPPPEDLSPWIPEGFDLYVIGAQECNYPQRGDFASCHADWGATLIRHFGVCFILVL